LLRFARSLGYAWAGVVHVARTQPNWRIHVVIGLLVVAAAMWLRVSLAELAVLALTIGIVLALEAMNTAVESTVDAIGAPPSTPAKHAKDSAAAAVLFAAVTAIVVGVIVLGQYLFALMPR
jgi:diacylglycerol kinase